MGKALSGFLTLLVAATVAYIAFQQYSINRRQYRLALFEKRMAVFNTTVTFIASVLQTTRPSLNDCIQFIRETRDHEFLFGADVRDFIDSVFKKATKLEMYNQMGAQNASERAETLNWFDGKIKGAREIFLKYLDFTDPY